jgi:hypothetical protein
MFDSLCETYLCNSVCIPLGHSPLDAIALSSEGPVNSSDLRTFSTTSSLLLLLLALLVLEAIRLHSSLSTASIKPVSVALLPLAWPVSVLLLLLLVLVLRVCVMCAPRASGHNCHSSCDKSNCSAYSCYAYATAVDSIAVDTAMSVKQASLS